MTYCGTLSFTPDPRTLSHLAGEQMLKKISRFKLVKLPRAHYEHVQWFHDSLLLKYTSSISVSVDFHSKFGKKCSLEFFSPAIANNQTSKIFTLIGNCINKRNKTTLIFVCYQDEMVEQCLSISFIQQQSHCSGHRAYHPSCC